MVKYHVQSIENASTEQNVANVLTVVDVSNLLKDFPSLSKDCNNPTMVNPTKYFFSVVSGNRAIYGTQGNGNIQFKADLGEVVRFSMVSEFNNFKYEVLIYNIAHLSGQVVLDVRGNSVFRKKSMMLNRSGASCKAFPPVTVEQSYNFVTCEVSAYGTENFTQYFALYDSQGDLIGYVKWDPVIVVEK